MAYRGGDEGANGLVDHLGSDVVRVEVADIIRSEAGGCLLSSKRGRANVPFFEGECRSVAPVASDGNEYLDLVQSRRQAATNLFQIVGKTSHEIPACSYSSSSFPARNCSIVCSMYGQSHQGTRRQ